MMVMHMFKVSALAHTRASSHSHSMSVDVLMTRCSVFIAMLSIQHSLPPDIALTSHDKYNVQKKIISELKVSLIE